MGNQAMKAIKSYLTPQECKLQLVEPGNHRVNAAACAIHTFKNRFIGALGTRGSSLKNVKFSNGTYVKSDIPESINR